MMKRIIIILVILFTLSFLEWKIGNVLEDSELSKYASRDKSDPRNYYKAPTGRLPYPKKQKGKVRFLYLSNSHARTGGDTSKHLGNFLNTIEPEKFEVFDLSDPGIFAPEMLERFAAGLSLNPDHLILSVAYISFSDRMNLRRQSHSARSFYRPEVFSHLPLLFWLRNYDIGLFTDTLFTHSLRMYRYRNELRDLIEKPLAEAIKNVFSNEPIRFLEIDQQQSWRFPDGFDRNLFDWSLYATGRAGHIADIKDLLTLAQKNDLPVTFTNLPVHWVKEPRARQEEDVRAYRKELQKLALLAKEYVDYEDTFPKEYSTYDALHPSWHGARLHAFDLLLRQVPVFTELTYQRALQAFQQQSPSLEFSPDICSTLKINNFIRYDIFDPENTKQLLCRLLTLPPGSKEEANYLKSLSARILYWKNTDFPSKGTFTAEAQPYWDKAFAHELNYSKKNLDIFTKELKSLQERKNSFFPMPVLDSYVPSVEKTIPFLHDGKKIALHYASYTVPEIGKVDVLARTKDKKPFAVRISPSTKQQPYTRYDILGDGSFLLLEIDTKKLFIPPWIYSLKIVPDWGT